MSKRTKHLHWQPELLEEWELHGIADPVVRHIRTLQQYIRELEEHHVAAEAVEKAKDEAYHQGYEDGKEEADERDCDTCEGILPALRRYMRALQDEGFGITTDLRDARQNLQDVARRYITF